MDHLDEVQVTHNEQFLLASQMRNNQKNALQELNPDSCGEIRSDQGDYFQKYFEYQETMPHERSLMNQTITSSVVLDVASLANPPERDGIFLAESFLVQTCEQAAEVKKSIGHFEFKMETTGMMSGITDTGGDLNEKPSEDAIPQQEIEIGEVSYMNLHPISDADCEG